MSTNSDFYTNYAKTMTQKINDSPEALFALALEKLPRVEADFDSIFEYVTNVDVTTLSKEMSVAVEQIKNGLQRLGWIDEEGREFGFVDNASLGNLRVNFQGLAPFPKIDSCAEALQVFDFIRKNKDAVQTDSDAVVPVPMGFEELDEKYVQDLKREIASSPELQLAVSFAALSHQDRSLTGFDLILKYVSNVDMAVVDSPDRVEAILKLRHTMLLLGWQGKEGQLAFTNNTSYRQVSMEYHQASGRYLTDLYDSFEAMKLMELIRDGEPVLKLLFAGNPKLVAFHS